MNSLHTYYDGAPQPVALIYSNGTQLDFRAVNEAARHLGVDGSYLRQYIKNGQWMKFGCRAILLPKPKTNATKCEPLF